MPSSKLSEHVSDSREKVHKKSKKTSKSEKSVELNESNRENLKEITQNARHKKMLKRFLDDRPQIQISKSSNNTEWTLKDFNDGEEELYVLHCPTSIDINQLLKARLTLPEGKSIEHHSVFESKDKEQNFECNSQLLNHKKHLTLICQTNGLPEAISVKQTGLITIHEKIDLPNDLSQRNTSERIGDVVVEYPKNLKIRHPLFGYRYDEETMKDELVSPQKKNKKKKKERHSQEHVPWEIDQIKTEISKSPKKLKRKHEEAIKTESSDDERPKKKKTKRESLQRE